MESKNITTGLMERLSRASGRSRLLARLRRTIRTTIGVTFFGASVISTPPHHRAVIADNAATSIVARGSGTDPGRCRELLRINLSFADGLPRGHRRHPGRRAGPQGELVLVLLGGANFDPSTSLTRGGIELDRPSPTSHASRVRPPGQHFCPGSALGRRHATDRRIEALLKRCPASTWLCPSTSGLARDSKTHPPNAFRLL